MTAPATALVLDFGGVISRTIFETQKANERALGLRAGTLNWCGPFDPAGDPLWRRAMETGKLVGEVWNELPQFLKRIRGTDPASAIRPEALSAIAAAKREGAKLAILSNELDLFYGADFRENLPFLAQFNLIVDATYTGILKPDPRAYAFVTEGLSVSAEACVFVDDQIKNILGAQNFGMRAVHFNVLEPAASYAAALAQLGIHAEA
jgi:putative hydrolase of the HAD superfamily